MKNIVDFVFYGFDIPTTMIAIGLLLNTIASVIVLIPYLITRIDIDDDLIVSSDERGKYTQRKHIKARRVGVFGFFLFALGFGFQLIGLIIQIHADK